MTSILQSIKPQYCELIAAGKKTIEIRKTRPKCDVPFKVYIYCTKGEYLWKKDNSVFLDRRYNRLLQTFDHMLNGKVIGEYVCDVIYEYSVYKLFEEDILDYIVPQFHYAKMQLTQAELLKYGQYKDLYGYHISDLKIYDKPKELSEFVIPCNEFLERKNASLKCKACPFHRKESEMCLSNPQNCVCNGLKLLTRPPQSWCYVEEVAI